MLEWLLIRNYQRHKELRLQFDRHVTTLVGKSDAGKSAVIRALCWLFFNRPAKPAMRKGASYALVQLGVDGRRVTRRKGKKGNEYLIDGHKAEAINRDVPEAVEQLLNVGPMNVQRQLDGPWWFDKTPGQVSSALNQIVNLGSIDQALAHLGGALRDARATARVTTERLVAAKQERERLAWVPQLAVRAKALTARQAAIAQKRAAASRLEALLVTLGRLQRQQTAAVALLPAAQTALAAARQLRGQQQQTTALSNHLDRLTQLEAQQCQLRTQLAAATEKRQAALAQGCPLCGSRPSQRSA